MKARGRRRGGELRFTSRKQFRFGSTVVAVLALGCGSTSSSEGPVGVDAGSEPNAGGSGGGSAAGGRSGPGGASSAGGVGVTGGSPSSIDGGGTNADASAACAASASAYCTRWLQCAPKSFNTSYGTLDNCNQSRTAECLDDLTAPGTAATVAGQTACGSARAAQTCAEFLTGPPPACAPLGTLSTGSPCKFDDQCASGLCVRPGTAAASCGACQPRAAAGAACDPILRNACQAGLRCVEICSAPLPGGDPCSAPSQWECGAPIPQGGQCTTSQQCASGLACLGLSCVALIPLGQPCAYGPNCAGDAGCVNQTCVALQHVDVGASCAASEAVCAATAACVNTGSGEVCVPLTGEGGPCTSSATCAAPLTCIQGTCKRSPPASSCQ